MAFRSINKQPSCPSWIIWPLLPVNSTLHSCWRAYERPMEQHHHISHKRKWNRTIRQFQSFPIYGTTMQSHRHHFIHPHRRHQANRHRRPHLHQPFLRINVKAKKKSNGYNNKSPTLRNKTKHWITKSVAWWWKMWKRIARPTTQGRNFEVSVSFFFFPIPSSRVFLLGSHCLHIT